MTKPYPFRATGACVDIAGQHANYRLMLTIDRLPTSASITEATELLHRLSEAFNVAEEAAGAAGGNNE